MEKFKISDEHAKVLKEYKVYSKFMRNIQNRECSGAKATYVSTEPLSEELAGAFDWAATPEGHDFWSAIRSKIAEAGL